MNVNPPEGESTNVDQRARATLLGLGQVDADQLEEVVVPLPPTKVEPFLGVQIHVHQPKEAALLVHDRESQQPVQGEELAGIEHRRRVRERDHLPDHNFRQRRLGRAQRSRRVGTTPWSRSSPSTT